MSLLNIVFECANVHLRGNCDILILNCYLISLKGLFAVAAFEIFLLRLSRLSLINKYRDFNHGRCLIPYSFLLHDIKILQAYARYHYPCDI